MPKEDSVEEPQEPVEPKAPAAEPEVPAEEADVAEEPVVDAKGEEVKDLEKAVHFKKPEPKEGSKRWNEIYKAAKEGERKLAEFTAKFDERESDIEALRQHNAKLAAALEAKEQARQQEAVATEKTNARQQLANLRHAQKAAIDEANYEKAFALENQILDLAVQIVQTKPEEIAQISTKATEQQGMNAAVEEFVKKTEWFSPLLPSGKKNPNYDPAKRGMAVALEQDLTPEWTGTYRELLATVKQKVEERFTEKKPETKPPIAGVAGVTAKAIPAETTVSLSSEEKRVVRMMFGDDPDGEKRYAAQKKALGRA